MYFSMISVALQQFREPLLTSIPWKENVWPKRGSYQWGLPVRIVYKDDSWNFFQMTMLFLAYVMTILRQLHFTRNKHFCRGATSREWLIQHNSYFLGVAATFSENSLLLSSYFLKIATYFERKFYGPATFCEYVVI